MDRKATAVWQGTLKEGKGTLNTQSGALKDLPYDFKARFQDESGRSGTNPEELLGAAHAGCFAMQLSALLTEHWKRLPPSRSAPQPVAVLKSAAAR